MKNHVSLSVELGSKVAVVDRWYVFLTATAIPSIPLIFFFFCPDRLRGSGTAATNMCLVATGAVEALFEIGIHCWDIAAGAVIVKEAGGILLDVDGLYDF